MLCCWRINFKQGNYVVETKAFGTKVSDIKTIEQPTTRYFVSYNECVVCQFRVCK
ncbi:hypothetical protein JCM19239_3195 [Vibrio variabilis]|uniref:Uncharacterized protein n=1 Tax=Vibrio variabilis TaxID=990271 RepID=A0ABQ0JIB4_9VIBR|nr:hypothetical protein JCM19239_3195 [Vibrio variabilis]